MYFGNSDSSAESLSSNSTVQNSFKEQPKKLPGQNFPFSSNSRTQSLNEMPEFVDLSRLKSCPPSFKDSQETFGNSQGSIKKFQEDIEISQESMAFIGKLSINGVLMFNPNLTVLDLTWSII